MSVRTSPRSDIEDNCPEPFARSMALFGQVVGFLSGDGADALSAAEMEARLATDGREIIRQLFQDRLDLRAAREARVEVTSASGRRFGSVEVGHHRPLTTMFGQVDVSRMAFRRKGDVNLYPADGLLNLPAEIHSHGLRHLAAVESSRGSFDEAVDAIDRATGQHLGKRQVEQLASRAAKDFVAYYEQRRPTAATAGDLLVLSADGKGIVMRPEALRQATAAAAKKSKCKLATRLSKGEKTNRKRMAEVGSVHDCEPAPRQASDIIAEREKAPGPKATGKWLTASVADDASAVIAAVFDEAERRDPGHERTWVALLDGNNHQIERFEAEAGKRGVELAIVVDFIHVIEYVWGAAWCFYAEGDPRAESWVKEKLLALLNGEVSTVAASISRKATCLGRLPSERVGVNKCVDYLLNKKNYLDYKSALAAGWPIATGVIEGAVRHVVKDRMDITGARWGLEGAEAVLKLRAVRSNGDFDDYWQFHLAQERRRVHEYRYADGVIPTAA
jgi:hypothetical protein